VFTKTLPVGQPIEDPLTVELWALRDAPAGPNPLNIAIENGTSDFAAGKIGVGPYLQLPLQFIPVKGGDVQVSISWDTVDDIDLHVVAPDGEEVYYGHRAATHSSGALDLDSNVGCNPGPQNENIYWPLNEGVTGEYIVRVDVYSVCVADPINVRTTVLLHEAPVLAFDTVFSASDADGGGEGDGLEITRFSFP
jgi:hypothetical protein